MPEFYVRRFKATKAEDAATKVTAESAKAAVEIVHGSPVVESVNVTVPLFYQVALSTEPENSSGYSPMQGQHEAGGVVDDLPEVTEGPQRKQSEMAEQSTRAKILARYGLPDALAFEFEAQQEGQQTLRVIVSHPSGTASMSTGHLSSLAHELESADRRLSDQIHAVIRKINSQRKD